uniref:Bulb-type lectin domain-containing protein n=1 Tax=Fagus sylvatica TaxID=28930 RepID=A0A2N9HXF9_FAGSY
MLVGQAVVYATEFIEHNWRQGSPGENLRAEKWKQPLEGVFKVNIAESKFSECKMGFGVVVRDSSGQMLAALAEEKVEQGDGLWRMAKAVWWGLQFCQDIGFNTFLLECPNAALVSLILNSTGCCIEVGWILKDIKELLAHMGSVTFSIIPNKCNRVAKTLAGYSKGKDGACTSLSVEKPSDKLVSANGEYSAGFYPVGDNAFCFAIWFNKSLVCNVVWMANRDDPVDGRVSQLSLLKEGKLILTNSVGITVWTTRTAALTTSDASNLQLQLLNTGNLVLHNSTGFVIWQSFDSPTDTLLPQQTLTMVSSLISKRSQGDYSSGNYLLSFNDDNVLRLLFQGPKISSVYWPDPSLADPGLAGRSKYGTRTRAVLNDSGYFESTDYFTFITTDYGVVTHRRLTLDPDGNLRLYSLQEMNGVWDWFVTWQAFSDPCKIHGTYGLNEFIVSCNNINESSFIQLAHVEYYGSDIDFYQNHTLQLCQDECLKSLIGTSLSVDKPSDNLVSENGEYSAGFFLVGDNAFCFAIWFNKSSNSTVVWMANRDDPVDGKGSKLSLLKDGKLILSNSVGITIWITRIAAPIVN